MTLKRLLYRSYVHFLEMLMQVHAFRSCRSINLSVETLPSPNRHCDIVTIAFNNLKTIERQIFLIRKHIQDDHTYIVADNSSNQAGSKAIEELCVKNDVSYIRLPKNHLGKVSGSYSHAASLNWVYYHIIKKRQPHYFGFIDHDLFPVKPVSIAQKLATQPIYGTLSPGGDYWFLWAGLCFYQFDFVKNKKIDFLPVKPNNTYLDTGGGNWYSIYSKMDRASLTFEEQEKENIGETTSDMDWFDNTMQYIGDCWLHTVAGSNWGNVSQEKLNEKELALDKKLKKLYKNTKNNMETFAHRITTIGLLVGGELG